jgi:CheY-like chemotaxis protein
MHMPDLDGIQLTQRIKASHPELPVILLSSVGDEKGKQHRALFGAVLSKPVRHKDLQTAITRQFTPARSLHTKQEQQQQLSGSFAVRFPLQILIAEDHDVNQVLIGMIMDKLGYKFTLVNNGQEALEAVQQHHYDLVLMDVQMPVMDGLEATKAIRKLSIQQPVVIALTANATREDKEVCMAAGMDDYISKPIQLDQFMRMLELHAGTVFSS